MPTVTNKVVLFNREKSIEFKFRFIYPTLPYTFPLSLFLFVLFYVENNFCQKRYSEIVKE